MLNGQVFEEILTEWMQEHARLFRLFNEMAEARIIVGACSHTFPNTGGRRSWCSQCNAIGNWDWRSGTFTAEAADGKREGALA